MATADEFEMELRGVIENQQARRVRDVNEIASHRDSACASGRTETTRALRIGRVANVNYLQPRSRIHAAEQFGDCLP